MARAPHIFLRPGSRSIQETAREITERALEIRNQQRVQEGLPPRSDGKQAAEPSTLEPDAPYPRPDRATPSRYAKHGAPEQEITVREYVLPDQRPCRVEAWWQDGAVVVTLFFSTRGLYDVAPEELVSLATPVLDAERVPAEMRRLTADDVYIIQDASHHLMFSLTFTVGVPH
ncbi:MAG: hypothetical protein JNL21_38930 [Myxococcales bacterium]|nr:hypothetical protein [Myxococcales bacterium]